MSAVRDEARGVVRFGRILFGLVCAAVYARAYFAIDLTDDAYYAALPWSFIHGRSPLVDEWAIQQLGAILVWPAFEVWVAWMGSSDGLILFQRHLHFAASVAAAVCVQRGVARLVDRRFAWPLAALVVAYVPFHMQALSYNTLAELGWLAGLFVLAVAVLEPGRGLGMLAASVLLGLATFAYPPMGLPVAAALALAVAATFELHGRTTGSRALLGLAAVGGMGGAVIFAWLVTAGGFDAWAGVLALDESLAAQGGGARKWAALLAELSLESGLLVAMLVWLNALLWGVVADLPPRATVGWMLALGLAPFALQPLYVPFTEPFTSAPLYWSALAVIAPFLWQRVGDELGQARRWAIGVVVGPSLVAAAVIVWASANGLRNASLGAFPAAIVALACAAWLVERRLARARTGVPSGLGAGLGAGLGLITCLVAFQTLQLWQNSYRNGPVAGLTVTMSSGPWAGIRTTPQRKQLLEQLQADLARHVRGAGSLFVYDYLPGAYLLAPLRPATVTLWTFPDYCCQGTEAAREVYAQAFSEPDDWPDLILENHCLLIEDEVRALRRPPGTPPDRLRARLFERPYRPVARHSCYTLYEASGDFEASGD